MSTQTASDIRYGRRGQTVTHSFDRRCVQCHKDATPRYLYCSDECALESLRGRWKADPRTKEEPLPPRLATLEAFLRARKS